MNPAIWICCFLPIIIVLIQRAEKKKFGFILNIVKRRKGIKTIMTDVLNAYIGKECIVYTMNDQVSGTVKEISDGWLVIDNGKNVESLNLDYVLRVREYPRNKKGKKVSVVLD